MLIEITCDHCSSVFKKEVKKVNQNRKLGHKCYCSDACKNASPSFRERSGTVRTICGYCKQPIKGRQSKLGKSKSGLLYCSKTCSGLANARRGKDHHNYIDGHTAPYRELALRTFENKCFVCGYDKVQVLEVHHKNKDRSDNEISNLIILCRNCHGEVHFDLLTL